MTTVGIIGGLGPESTVEYYRQLIAAYRQRRPDGSYPLIVIISIDMQRLLRMIGVGDLTGATDYLMDGLDRLARAGADVALLASNTPHIVFDELRRRSTLPLISIVEATCVEASRRGLTRLGLLGTSFTMQGGFYPQVFSKAGITIAVADPEEQAYVHEKYMAELVHRSVSPDTRAGLLTIVEALERRHGIQGLILGGTDLSVMFRGDTVNGLQVFDTTRIHVDVAATALLESPGQGPPASDR